MVLAKANKDTKLIIINCNCGCDEEIHVKKFIDSDIDESQEEYYLSIHTSKFYSNQQGILRLIGHRIKLAFKMLFGKEYLLCDLVLNKTDIDEFIKELEEIKKN